MNKFEKEILDIMEKNKVCGDGMTRLSLLQSHVMEMMANAKSLEELNDIYSKYCLITHNYPI